MYTALMDHDPLPVLRRVEAPMLWLLSPDDESIDAVETEAILRGLAEAGHRVEVVTYAGYDHAMRRIGARWPSPPPDDHALQARFIQRAVTRP